MPALMAQFFLPLQHYYLHNVTGQTKADRLESWPGAYRLDLTKSEVALFKVRSSQGFF